MAMEEAMKIGFGVLKLAPEHFWSMTPREFAAALRGAFPAPEGGPSRGDFEKLMVKFPDSSSDLKKPGEKNGRQ